MLALLVGLASPAVAQEAEPDAPPAGADELQLAPIEVTASVAGVTENTGAYASEGPTASATGLPLTLRETPQSVSILTQQRIIDQNVTTLTDAVRATPGLIAAQGGGETRWQYFARGSTIQNVQYDGIPTYVHWFTRDASPEDDMAMYDRMEVVRGATGLMEGAGNPSASINLVRKRPLAEKQFVVEAGASSFGNGTLTFDASSPLNAEGTVRGRVVASGLAGDGYRDNLERNRGLLYGVIDVDIGDRTTASIGASYNRDDIKGYSWGGFPTQVGGAFFPFEPTDSPSLDWEYNDREQLAGYVDVTHEFGGGWELRAAGRATHVTTDFLSSYVWWSDPETLTRNGGHYEYDNKGYALDTMLSGPVTLFGRQHDLIFGANANLDNTNYVYDTLYAFPFDPGNLDPGAFPKPDFTGNLGFNDQQTKQYGAYAAARLSITDPLTLILGSRVSWYEYSTISDFGSDGYSVDAEVTPYVGAVYDLNDTYSVYGSYTGIFMPQQYYGVNGGLIDPVTGTNAELGVKADLMDGRLIATAAVFQADQDGLPEVIPGAAFCNPTSPSCYRNAGLIRTNGVEFEVNGAVTDRWNLMASYTYADSVYQDGENEGDRYNSEAAPRNMVKLATSYDLPGTFENWTVGGALRYQSGLEATGVGTEWGAGGSDYTLTQGGYTVADLMARYEITEATSLQVNVDNVFDKTYYSAISTPSGATFFGEPRSASILLRHMF